MNKLKNIMIIFFIALPFFICSCTVADNENEIDNVIPIEEESLLNDEELIVQDESKTSDNLTSINDLSNEEGQDVTDFSEAEIDYDFFHFSTDTIEQTLIQDAWLRKVFSANWIASQGDSIVPLLEELLDKHAGNELFYSFGVYWALGQIGSSKAEQLLLKHENNEYARLALKALRARNNAHDPDRIGVIYNRANMYAKPNMNSEIIGNVEIGDIVFYLESYIENENELGPRGGYVIYDYFEIANTGLKGYVIRRAEGFSPTM